MTEKVIKPETVGLQNDVKVHISTGKSRYEKEWKNKEIKWSALVTRLGKRNVTGEAHAEYMKFSKEQQDRIKDIGGFVGGHLDNGRRKNENVQDRQILTLDADFPKEGFWDTVVEKLDCAACIYSTHKHCEKNPRLRLIIPLEVPVSADEYEAIARKVADKIGMDYFDDSTFQVARLMYWPSASADVDPVFEYIDRPILNGDVILDEYPDWTDTSYWPESSRESGIRKKMAARQGDPLEKSGVLGAFCRTYSIHDAIEKFLSEVYTPTSKEDRYTYTEGSTVAGLVIYEDGKFAYSNHSTDPCSGKLCNAYDLVRIHLFGHLDDDSEKPPGRRESDEEMRSFAVRDQDVRKTFANEQAEKARREFSGLKEDEDWRDKLSRNNKTGVVEPNGMNARIILLYDEELQSIRLNELSGRIVADKVMPWGERQDDNWKDADDAQLYFYVSGKYGIEFPQAKFTLALQAAADSRRFHPIREYLDSLPDWDGVERIEEILIKYLCAADNIYTRDATRKFLTAAVARIYEPGIKFDNSLVLVGPQSCGKTTLFGKLGMGWYSDSLKLGDMKDRTGVEKLQGKWIIEMGEMAGRGKADIDMVKNFLSAQEDNFRAAYGRNVECRKRQCVIAGTTNAPEGFLRDITGNRRFWPVDVHRPDEGKKCTWDLTSEEVNEIWAEAKFNYFAGESLVLEGEADAIAQRMQTAAMETDERLGLVMEYLDILLPDNWDEMELDERRMYIDDYDGNGGNRRQTITNMEVWSECFRNPPKAFSARDSREITAMLQKIDGWKPAGRRRFPIYGMQRYRERL